MKNTLVRALSVFLTVLFVITAINPALIVFAEGEAITITDENGAEITEKVEVQEYRSVQLYYAVTPEMPEGAYVTWKSNLPLLADVDDTGKVTGYDYSKAAIIQLWLDEEVRSIPIVGEATAKAIESAIESSGVDIETVNTDVLVAIVSGVAGDAIGESLRNYLDNMNVVVTATLWSADGVQISKDTVDVLVTQSVVASVAPTGVHITNKKTVPKTVAVGTTVQLYGAVTPVRLKQGVKWTVGKSAVDFNSKNYASVSEDGLVTFFAPGTATIRVNPSSTVYAAFTDTVTFTVVNKEELPVTDFTITGSSSVQEGATVTLGIDNVVPAGAYTGDIVWESSDPSVAIIDQDGNVTGLDGGSGFTFSKTVTITASIGDVVRTLNFTVSRAGLSSNLSGIEIVGEDSLAIGQASQYTSNVFPARLNTNSSVLREWGFYEDGEYIIATADAPAVSSLGTIDANGMFTPTASGMSTIVARATLNGATVETTKSVFSGKPITDFTISGGLSVSENKTTQLTITSIVPEDYDEEILENIKWTTSNPLIATVDDHGLVRGIDGGDDGVFSSSRTAEITATVGGVSRTVTVTVKKNLASTLTSAYIGGPDCVIKDFPVQYSSSFSPERLKLTGKYWGTVTNDGQTPFDNSLLVNSAKNTENDIISVSNSGVVTGKTAGETELYLYGKNVQSYVITGKNIDVIEIEPKSITVTAPTKTEYLEGETELDLEGLKVELTYNREDIEKYYGDTSSMYTDDDLKVEVTDYTVGEINPKILDTEQYIVLTVTRAGKNYRGVFSITLESKKVESIELTNPRYKYLEGETELDLEGLKVQANYSNAPSEFVDDYIVLAEEFNPTLYNVEQNITVTYTHEGLTAFATFPVIVYGIPVVSVDTNGYNGEWTPGNITFTLSATNELDGITYYYRTESSSTWLTVPGNTLKITTDLQNVYYFKAINSAGIESEETSGYIAKRDGVTPYFTLDKEINDVTNKSFNILIKDLRTGSSGVKSITVNGEDITGKTTYTVSENGNYTVTVTANNGLSRTQVKTVSNIDREAPVIKKIELKHKLTGDNARELTEEEFGLFFNEIVELTVRAEDVGVATVGKIEYRLLDENKVPVSSEWIKYNELEKPQISPEFKGFVEVKATDKAGNESAVYYSSGFVVDNDCPTDIVINAVSNGEAYVDGTWTSDNVKISLDSYAFSGIYEYLYRIDGGEWISMESPDITVSDEGEHLLEFKTVSYSALESKIASINVKIDRQKPVIRVEFEGTFKRWTGENMTFKFTTLEPSISGITYYYNDGNGWTEITTGNEIVLYDNINANYQFKAVNGAGTESTPSDSYIVMIDTVVPQVTATKEVTELTTSGYKVNLSYTYGEAGIQSVTFNGEDITGKEYITVNKNGTYLITVTGNNLKTGNYLLTVDNIVDPSDESNRPVLQVTVNGVTGTRTGEDITFNFYTPNQSNVTYYYNNGNGWIEISGSSLTLTESEIADYKFKAVNQFGIESYESPVYSVILDKSKETGSRIYGTISVEDTSVSDTVTIKLYTFDGTELVSKKTVNANGGTYSLSGVENGGYILIAECNGNIAYRSVVVVSGNTEDNIVLVAGERLIGDVDLDGDIDRDDYNLMINNIRCGTALSETQLCNADINGDGAVDGIDALYLDLYLNGKVKLP